MLNPETDQHQMSFMESLWSHEPCDLTMGRKEDFYGGWFSSTERIFPTGDTRALSYLCPSPSERVEG